MSPSHPLLQRLAETILLGETLQMLGVIFPDFEMLDHWTQGEFHHDLVFQIRAAKKLPGDFLVVSTNCNGGVKEIVCLAERPERWALWNQRCPENPEFDGELAPLLAVARTELWFDPCEILVEDARSELLPSCRTRARGGGWEMK